MASDDRAFIGAGRHIRTLTSWGCILAAAGLALAGVGLLRLAFGPALLSFAVFQAAGAGVLLGAAGLLAAALVAWSRVGVAKTLATGLSALGLGWRANWPQVGIIATASAVAIVAAIAGLRDGAQSWTQAGPTGLVASGLLTLAAFPILVLERHLAGLTAAELPEAEDLAWLLRIPVVVLAVTGIASLLAANHIALAPWLARSACAFAAVAAAELLLRAVAAAFLPPAPAETPRFIARSTVSRALRTSRFTPGGLGRGVREQFGIDLSRSWALGFLSRAALPALAGLMIASWLLTGVTVLRLTQRAVYEQFGAPVAVFQPGLHWHWPWPLGTVRLVELDVVHELALSATSSGSQAPPDAEAMPPASADRLWNQAHPSEAGFIIAGLSNGQQSFQAVNIDLRLMIRSGASDADALRAAYAVVQPDALVRAAAGRILSAYFATHTLPGVLGADRDAFTTEIGSRLQAELDALGAGLTVVAVVVEAIHPPPGAAAAYQSVQASEIRALELIAAQTGLSAKAISDAGSVGESAVAGARASAAEILAVARHSQRLFAADRAAHDQFPASFMLEQRLQRLSGKIGRGTIVIVDHRLSPDAMPTLDLRSASGMAPTP